MAGHRLTRGMLAAACSLAAVGCGILGQPNGIFLGDWSDLGDVAIQRQKRARRTIAVAVGLIVVAFVIIEIVSPIRFI